MFTMSNIYLEGIFENDPSAKRLILDCLDENYKKGKSSDLVVCSFTNYFIRHVKKDIGLLDKNYLEKNEDSIETKAKVYIESFLNNYIANLEKSNYFN